METTIGFRVWGLGFRRNGKENGNETIPMREMKLYRDYT